MTQKPPSTQLQDSTSTNSSTSWRLPSFSALSTSHTISYFLPFLFFFLSSFISCVTRQPSTRHEVPASSSPTPWPFFMFSLLPRSRRHTPTPLHSSPRSGSKSERPSQMSTGYGVQYPTSLMFSIVGSAQDQIDVNTNSPTPSFLSHQRGLHLRPSKYAA